MWSIHSDCCTGLVKSCFTSQPVRVCVCVCAGRAGRPASQSEEKEEGEVEESEKVMGCIGIPERAYVRRYIYE